MSIFWQPGVSLSLVSSTLSHLNLETKGFVKAHCVRPVCVCVCVYMEFPSEVIRNGSLPFTLPLKENRTMGALTACG